MKYCDQCGRPLKDEAKFCDFCGRECKKPSERMKAINKNRKPPKKSGFKRFLAAVVVISICIAAAAFFWNKDKISPVKSADDTIAQLEKTGKLLRQVNTYENDVLKCITDFRYNENGLITEVADHLFGEEYRYSESITTFAYDYADRVIESRVYLGSAKENVESTEYTYNDKGQLASIHRKDTHGEGIVTYEYDSQGKLVRAVSEDNSSRTVFLYDEEGNLLESTTYHNDGQTYTVKDIHRTKIIYDGEYKPFIIRATEIADTGSVEAIFAQIEDVMGTAIYSFPLTNPEFTADGDGYLVKVKDVLQYSDIVRTYLFYYDGDELPQEPEETTTGTQNAEKGNSKLKYPISEEDCYIIYKNYFGYEMEADESIQVVVTRLGEGDKENLFFAIYHLNEVNGGFTWAGTFIVYVNTGVCERDDIVFQADDYYY